MDNKKNLPDECVLLEQLLRLRVSSFALLGQSIERHTVVTNYGIVCLSSTMNASVVW